MKKAAFGVLALCLMGCCAWAQAPASKSAKPASDEETLKQIERDWGNALVKADMATLDRIMADDWLYTGADGATMTKAQNFAGLKSGQTKIASVVLDDLKVRMFGDAAIVHGGDTAKSSEKGKDTSGHYRWTDVFVKRGGRWLAVATHESKVTKP